MSKKYQVLKYTFNYDSECFQHGDTVVHSTHSNKEDADLARLQIEKIFWFSTDLNQVIDFFDNEPKIQSADDFLQKELGVSFHEIDVLPRTLSDDGLLRFLKATGARAAKVVAIDLSRTYYVLKFIGTDLCMRRAVEEWESPTYLDSIVRGKSLATLKTQAKWNIRANLEVLKNFEFSGRDLVLHGTFEDLSDDPKALEQVWREYKQIRFKKKESLLLVNGGSANALFDLNDVLKKPLFVIKEMTFDEITALEGSEKKRVKKMKKSDPNYEHTRLWLDRIL